MNEDDAPEPLKRLLIDIAVVKKLAQAQHTRMIGDIAVLISYYRDLAKLHNQLLEFIEKNVRPCEGPDLKAPAEKRAGG